MKSLGEVEFEYLFLKDAKLRPCLGCYACMALGEDKCPLRDDRAAIEEGNAGGRWRHTLFPGARPQRQRPHEEFHRSLRLLEPSASVPPAEDFDACEHGRQRHEKDAIFLEERAGGRPDRPRPGNRHAALAADPARGSGKGKGRRPRREGLLSGLPRRFASEADFLCLHHVPRSSKGRPRVEALPAGRLCVLCGGRTITTPRK